MKTLEELAQLARDIHEDIEAGDLDAAVRALAESQSEANAEGWAGVNLPCQFCHSERLTLRYAN